MKGKMVVISGFSGTGKGTLVRRLIEKYPEEFVVSISKTTRAPRTGEIDGQHYFFISRDQFEQEIADGRFIEHAEFNGNYYGTPLDWVTDRMDEGKNVILEIEVQGALQVRQRFPDALLIFVVPPSIHELVRRLISRGTEDPEVIMDRLRIAAGRECGLMNEYDHIAVNDDLETCVEDIRSMAEGTYENTDMSEVTARLTEEIIKITESGDLLS